MPYYRSDQALVTVAVKGVKLDQEPWDMFEGAELTTQELKVFPGGMKPQVQLGGQAERSPAVVQRKWSNVLAGITKALEGVCGDNIRGVTEIQVTPLNAKGEAQSSQRATFTGVLTGVERPKYKAGPSEEILLKLTVGLNGPVA